MATGQRFARCATKVWLWLLLLAGCYACFLLLYHRTSKDVNGRRPRDVARAFIEAVRSNDFQKAASYWKPGTTRYVESNFQMKFEDFCVRVFKCDDYKLGLTTRQKEGSRLVPFRGTLRGINKAYSLYFELVNGEWKITEDLWIPSASDPWQNPEISNQPSTNAR